MIKIRNILLVSMYKMLLSLPLRRYHPEEDKIEPPTYLMMKRKMDDGRS